MVLRAERRRWTRRGRAFGILAVGFVVVFLIGADLLLRAIGLPGVQRSPWLRTLVMLIAVLPFAVVGLSIIRPRTGSVLGLLHPIPTRAVIDPSGIELSIDGWKPEFARWDEIAGLARADADWRLFGPDGATVMTVPRELIRPRPSWFDAPTLAEAVVQLRPDRYALRGGRFEPGLTEFDLRETTDPVGRPPKPGRPRVLLAGIVLFVVAFVVLTWWLGANQ